MGQRYFHSLRYFLKITGQFLYRWKLISSRFVDFGDNLRVGIDSLWLETKKNLVTMRYFIYTKIFFSFCEWLEVIILCCDTLLTDFLRIFPSFGEAELPQLFLRIFSEFSQDFCWGRVTAQLFEDFEMIRVQSSAKLVVTD